MKWQTAEKDWKRQHGKRRNNSHSSLHRRHWRGLPRDVCALRRRRGRGRRRRRALFPRASASARLSENARARRGVHQGRSSSVDRGPLGFRADRIAHGQSSQERWFRESREPGKEQRLMAYSDKVVDHYNNPRNVGSMPKEDPNVGTGLVGAPECGDVMKLQMKINPDTQVIEEAKFKTFGCGSAIASSSLATEWVKGKTVEEALSIKNTDIVKELSLPPVKIHCSVLAEDAIRAAIGDWKKKQEATKPVAAGAK